MKNDLIKVAASLLLLYFLQFIVAPFLFPIFYPSTNESTGILFGSIALCSLLGMIFISTKLRHWLLCDIPYFLLMILFSNNGAYGIGLAGIPIDGNEVYYNRSVSIYLVLLIAVVTIILQLFIWGVIKIIQKLVSFTRKNSMH